MVALGLLDTVCLRLIAEEHPAAVPRCLADDKLVATFDPEPGEGPLGHVEEHEAAVQTTIDSMHAMGGVISGPKCNHASTGTEARRLLRGHGL